MEERLLLDHQQWEGTVSFWSEGTRQAFSSKKGRENGGGGGFGWGGKKRGRKRFGLADAEE